MNHIFIFIVNKLISLHSNSDIYHSISKSPESFNKILKPDHYKMIIAIPTSSARYDMPNRYFDIIKFNYYEFIISDLNVCQIIHTLNNDKEIDDSCPSIYSSLNYLKNISEFNIFNPNPYPTNAFRFEIEILDN